MSPAPILDLPNELLIAIARRLPALRDLAALAQTCRRFCSVAVPELFARIPRSHSHVRHALFYFVENGLLEPVRRLLDLGVNPNVIYCSPVPRDRLLRLLAAQGRRPGRCPLVDRKFVLEYADATIELTQYDPHSDLDESLRHLINSPPLGQNRRFYTTDESTYNFVVHELHTIVTQMDVVWDAKVQKMTEPDGSEPSTPSETMESIESLYHWTALHVAALRGDDALVRLLLDRGAAPNPLLAVDENPDLSRMFDLRQGLPVLQIPQTPLFHAILAGNLSTAQLLLASGASLMVAGRRLTALHVAAWRGHLPLCEALADRDPTMIDRMPNQDGLMPFEYAVAAGHLKTVGRFLLERDGDLNTPPHSPERSERTLLQLGAQRRGALNCALRFGRYADALWLMDLGVGAGQHHQRPFAACLARQGLSAKDEEQMLPLLRRLAFDPVRPDPDSESQLAEYMRMAAAKHLPQTIRLLLEVAEHRSFPPPDVLPLLKAAPLHDQPNSAAAVETIMLLIDYAVAKAGMPLPCLSSWFLSLSFPEPWRHLNRIPFHHDLKLTKSPVAAARLLVAQLLYDRLAASPVGVQDEDLREALIDVCQPGGLTLCQWLADVGALRLVTMSDLGFMLFRTAMSNAFGGNDPDLARWVLEQADRKGVKADLLRDWDVPGTISRSQELTVAKVLLSHDAPLTQLTSGRLLRRPPTAYPVILSCRNRRRLLVHHLLPAGSNHPIVMACLRPDMPGAEEVLRLAIEADPERAAEWISNTIILVPSRTVHHTLASLILGHRNVGPQPTDTPVNEPQVLAMLKLLMAHGADVHETLIERDIGTLSWADPPDVPGPSAELWRALVAEDELEIARLQEPTAPADGPHHPQPPRWKLAAVYRPMMCAIDARMPSVVRAMLETQPLTERNSPVALRYLRAACSGLHRVCPEILEIVLEMGNIDDVDRPTGADGLTPLMTLMDFFLEEDFVDDAPALTIHPECRCEPELRALEEDDLCTMIRMLLERGAKWTTRSPVSRRTALDKLRELLGDSLARMGVYKLHNVAKLRKHIVLDVFEEGVEARPGFNPFEMGNVKATRGEEPGVGA